MIEKVENTINDYLDTILTLIGQGKFQVELNGRRQDNLRLRQRYVVGYVETKTILLSLTAEDFIKEVPNTNAAYGKETLFIFTKAVELTRRSTLERVILPLYIKINLIKKRYVRVVSLHPTKVLLQRRPEVPGMELNGKEGS